MSQSPPRAAPPAPRPPPGERTRLVAKWTFRAHLWMGVLATGMLLLVSITGILLNHKRPLGLMPEVEHQPTASLDRSLSIAELARRAEAAVPGAAVDRMDVRPDDGLIKVRMDDRVVSEVTLDLHTGAVLEVGERNDVFLEKLHSGEIFGDNWILLSDAAAVIVVLLVISGYGLWLYPRTRH